MSSVSKFYKLTSKFFVDYNNEILKKLQDKLELDEEKYASLVEILANEFEAFDFKKQKRGGRAKSEGTSRAPTKYNLFVKDFIHDLRKREPDTDRKDLMKKAAAAWRLQKDGAVVPEKKSKSKSK